MGVRMVLSDFVPKKKLKLIRIRGRNFCVACEAVFKREKNEASKFILKFEEEIKKKNKHIRNKVLGDTLRFATKICEEIQLAPYNMKNHGDKIDASDTELLQKLDKLDKIAKKYEKMSTPQQIMFLKEAEKIFNAFDKVPASIWEEETNKYQNVLEAYKDIKVMRWIENDKSNVKEEVTDTK